MEGWLDDNFVNLCVTGELWLSAAKRSSSSPWTPHYPAALGPTPSTTSLDEASTVAADEDQVVDRNNAAMAGELPLSPEDLSSDVSHSCSLPYITVDVLDRPSLYASEIFIHSAAHFAFPAV
jgi:hypothetical protein